MLGNLSISRGSHPRYAATSAFQRRLAHSEDVMIESLQRAINIRNRRRVAIPVPVN
jgi:hypothetical protein